MNDGLKQLQEEGIKWVDANKSKRFSGVTKLLTDLYPDNAHFIYELLQNAEDARDKTRPNSRGASVVRFTLNTDSLEFEHDGEGLFNLANVESITGIGDSNKSDDPTSIGKFGVGFKAVFAYTNTPEIHSGDYHFLIRDLVVPEPIESCQLAARATKFVFPFNHQKKLAERAKMEIAKGLCDLGDNTLLFLKCIRKIEFLLPNGSLGSQERVEDESGRIAIRTLRPDGADGEKRVSHWQRFEQVVKATDEKGDEKDCRIAIAYSLTNSAKDNEPPAWKVTPLEHGQVSIFFPAEKETSNLHFHIHAPFASTVARDSVRDCEENKALVRAIAELTANKLENLRDLDLLNIASYAALPLRDQDFLEERLFRPVYDKVREAFKTKPLLPADGGDFIKADEAKLAGGKELVTLFSPVQLGSLFAKERLVWLDATITERPETADFHTYLVGRRKNQLSSEWEQEPLVENVEVEPKDIAAKLSADFFQHQDEQWLMKFYATMDKNYTAFKDTPFVRLENNTHVSVGTAEKPNAYLPPVTVADIDQAIFPLVKTTLASNREVAKFLHETAKLREPDKVDVILRCILLKYHQEGSLRVNDEDYVSDLKQISEAYSNAKQDDRTRLVDSLEKTAFVFADSAWDFLSATFGDEWGAKPGRVMPRDPYLHLRSPDLEQWFSGNSSDSAWFPLAVVGEHLSVELQKKLGFASASFVQSRPPGQSGRSEGGFDSKANIVGLRWVVSRPTHNTALILWDTLLKNQHLIKGSEFNSRNEKSKSVKADKYSVLGKLCCEHHWLPKQDAYSKPADIFLSELPDDFEKHTPRAEFVSRALGMKQPVDLSSIAKACGLTIDEIRERIDITPEEVKEVKQRRQDKEQSSQALPQRKSLNPERREKKIEEEVRNTPPKTTEVRQRSVDLGYNEAQGAAKTYLKHQYTVDDKPMICQICNATQPVMLNDVPHFEAVDCVGGINAHYEKNKLALCPNHAAMYKNSDLTPDAVRRAILECKEGKSQMIPLNLADNKVALYFTQQHLDDLCAVLNASNKNPGDACI